MRLGFLIKVVWLVLFLVPTSLLAQEKAQKILEVSYEAGPLISNGNDWANEIRDLVSYRGIDVRYGWRKVSDDFYSQLYRYPTFGIGASIAVPYYSEIGRPMGVYVFGEFPFSNRSIQKKLDFSYFAQIGLGFGLNPFDSIDNPLNRYIGSELNAYIHFGFKADYQLAQRLKITSSVGLKHYSNGSTKRPNAGINLAPISIGLRYHLNDVANPTATKTIYPPLEKRGFWNFAVYTGYKNYEVGDPSYFRGGLGINYLWQGSYKYRLGIGLDYFYAPGFEERNPGRTATFSNQSSLALVGSWEWMLSERLYMPIGLGVYVHYNGENQESWFYERIGVRYRIDNHIFAGVQIKAHKAKADFFEFTLGYTIPSKVKRVINP